MATRATGTFRIDNWDENEILQTDGGSKVTNAKVSRSFEGDLEGNGIVEWLMGYDEGGSATFVGLERVVGRVGDRTGTFVPTARRYLRRAGIQGPAARRPRLRQGRTQRRARRGHLRSRARAGRRKEHHARLRRLAARGRAPGFAATSGSIYDNRQTKVSHIAFETPDRLVGQAGLSPQLHRGTAGSAPFINVAVCKSAKSIGHFRCPSSKRTRPAIPKAPSPPHMSSRTSPSQLSAWPENVRRGR